jgi:hypothetical protein
MPWVECLLFIAVAYVAVVVVRGIVQAIAWFMEEFLTVAREPNRATEKPPPRHHDSASATVSASANRESAPPHFERKPLVLTEPIHPVRWSVEFLRSLVCRRRFQYWVEAALGETDPDKRVKYCSKALRLNPAYEPAWGLKANALLELKRYEEAVPCFDKVLEMRPNSMAWYRKGIGCYHLKRYEEAAACFDKTLAACAGKDHQLFDEASHHKKAAEEEWQQQRATG